MSVRCSVSGVFFVQQDISGNDHRGDNFQPDPPILGNPRQRWRHSPKWVLGRCVRKSWRSPTQEWDLVHQTSAVDSVPESTPHYTTLPTWSFTVLTLVAVFSVRQVSLSVNSSFLLVTKASCVTASSEGTLCDFMWTEPLKANRLDLRFFCEHVIRVQIIRRIDIPLLVGFYFRYRFKCQKPIDLLFFSPFSSCFVGKLKCLDL